MLSGLPPSPELKTGSPGGGSAPDELASAISSQQILRKEQEGEGRGAGDCTPNQHVRGAQVVEDPRRLVCICW